MASHLAAGLAISLVLTVPAHAQDTDPLASQLDRPVSTKKVAAKSDDDPIGRIECTYYRDFMLRETGTDSPDPNDAALIPIAPGAPRPACDATPRDGERNLKTQGYSYLGRKGHFLLFSATDPNGAVPFMLLDAGDGRIIFEDAVPPDRGTQTITLEKDTLRLGYTRAFNASCSLLKDPAGCWSGLVAEGRIPAGLPQPPPTLCAASYKEEQAPAEDPSIVSYAVNTTIDASGHAQTIAHGTIGCAPMP